MFLASIGRTDDAARFAIDEISALLPDASIACSVRGGVAIACWQGVGLERSVFANDYAYVGNLRGEFPAPGTELRGDFALVARSSGGLRMARGRFAGRPLYWMRIGSVGLACSRMLPLAMLSGRGIQINLDHLLSLFDARSWMANAPLPFIGAERVRPNTLVDMSATGPVLTRVAPIRIEEELSLPPRELARALRREFEGAVGRECAGSRQVAVLAGGGVDSSNLLAVAVERARQLGTREPIALAIDVGGDGDDRPHLRALCRHLEIEPLRVAPSEGAAYAGQDHVVDGTVQGIAPQSTIFAAMARAKDLGADLVLTGDGSEWTLDGVPSIFGDFLLRDPLGALQCMRRFRSIYETRPQSFRRLLMGPLLRLVVPTFLLERRRSRLDQGARLRRSRSLAWAGPRLKAFLAARPSYPRPSAIQSQRARVLELASSTLPTMLREFYSRWEVACGLPISFPYLDDDFARFVARIPSAGIFACARERGLLREAMDGLVPDSVRYRTDKARPHRAFAELFSAMGGLDAVGDLITMRELERLGIVDAPAFRASFLRFAADPRADASGWGTLWPAIAGEAYVRWFNEFKERGLRSPAAPLVSVFS